jgi:phospholipid/cholesterol/gamma-HCH transport system substrate-binding protein
VDGSVTGLRRTRLLAVGAVLVGILAVMVVAASGGGGHNVVVTADQARFLHKGADVRVAGRTVGKISEATPTRQGIARLELEIDDDRVWPLPRGTQVHFRWLSTIALAGRYVELVLPAKGGPAIPEGGTIAADDVTSAVELDDVFRTLDRPTRRNLRGLFTEAGPALANGGDDLRRALVDGPSAVAQADAVLGDLGADERKLDTLVRSVDSVAHAVETSNPGIGRLLTGAAKTFDAIGSRSRELQRVMTAMPPTLDTARETLAHADRTLIAVNGLAGDLAPGVAQVRRLAPPLNRTLATLVRIGPDARRTLGALRRAAPDLNPLLTRARTLMPRIRSVSRQAATQLNCIRPFAPEIASFATNWTAMSSWDDGQDKFFRGNGTLYPFATSSAPLTSADAIRLFPGLDYAFPRPPGQSSGQPWFLPECNLGPETLDPTKDPESR